MATLAGQEIVIHAEELNNLVAKHGNRVRQMGFPNSDGSISVSREFAPDNLIAALELPEGGALIDRIVEAKRSRIAELTRLVRSAPTEAEAKEYWAKLEHLMFGL